MKIVTWLLGGNPEGTVGLFRNTDACGEPRNLCGPCGVLAKQADCAGGQRYADLCAQIWAIQSKHRRGCDALGCATKR